jgi:hypothetical protein
MASHARHVAIPNPPESGRLCQWRQSSFFEKQIHCL